MSEQNKTDAVQSIAELQESPAKRDSRIEELGREIERLDMNYNEACDDAMDVARELAALKAKPSGVVLPERLRQVLAFLDGSGELDGFGFGEHPAHLGKFWWRTELRAALAELNLPTAPSTKCQTCQDSGVVSTTDKDHNGDHIEQRCPDCSAGGVDERAADALEQAIGLIDLVEHQPPVLDQARRILVRLAAQRAALNAGSAVPDGWVMVPEHPTDVMVQSVIDSGHYSTPATAWQILVDEYRAMLAAAPSPGQPAGKKAPSLVECDRCPTSGGCLDVCMRDAPTAKKEG